jgi:hypothetical protein
MLILSGWVSNMAPWRQYEEDGSASVFCGGSLRTLQAVSHSQTILVTFRERRHCLEPACVVKTKSNLLAMLAPVYTRQFKPRSLDVCMKEATPNKRADVRASRTRAK